MNGRGVGMTCRVAHALAVRARGYAVQEGKRLWLDREGVRGVRGRQEAGRGRGGGVRFVVQAGQRRHRLAIDRVSGGGICITPVLILEIDILLLAVLVDDAEGVRHGVITMGETALVVRLVVGPPDLDHVVHVRRHVDGVRRRARRAWRAARRRRR